MITTLRANLMLIIVTVFWGASYIFMKMGLESLQEFNLIALRFGVAFILTGAIFYKRILQADFKTIKYSFILGTILFLVFLTVTFGVQTTSTSNAGFLVSLTVIFVPLILSLFFKKLPEKKIVIGVIISLLGIALLTLKSNFEIRIGDILCIMTALFYAGHIILTSKFTKFVDSLSLGILQLGVTALWGLFFSLVFEVPHLPSTTESWISILGLGILCSAIGFVVQTVAQKYTTPTNTGLIFTLEPVFAALFAFLFLDEILTTQGYLGALLVLLGVLFAEIDFKAFNKKEVKHATENF